MSEPNHVCWYNTSVAEAVSRLNANEVNGITAAQARERLKKYGPNEIVISKKISAWNILFNQLKNTLIVILLIAVVLSLILGHTIEAVAISAILFLAVLLGFLQEYRAERAMEALRKMAAPNATVVRDGIEMEITANEIVPGDLILIRAGDRIPADARLSEAYNLQAEESALTGESLPVEKDAALLRETELSPGDQKNMVFAGTIATYGRGRAMVVATGMQTLFGKIARMLETVQTGKTPLQQNLDHVGGVLARAAILIVLLIVALGIFRGQPFLELIIFGIALAVAVVPEALPAVVTISLAIGVQRMVKRNALIRSLPAVETLGSTTVICTDKTGTLTKDEMTVRRIFAGNQNFEISGSGYDLEGDFRQNGSLVQPSKELIALLTAAVLSSDAHLQRKQDQWEVKGDPTETALIVAARKAGIEKTNLDQQNPRIDEIPFTAERKRMTTLHRDPSGQTVAYSKGAPEIILHGCPGIKEKEIIIETAKEMAREGMRVLAIASRENATTLNAEKDMTFLGLVGMIDPPRTEARNAVKKAQHAGIKIVMITGDHPLTATAVAREVGIHGAGRIITGAELDSLKDDELMEQVDGIDVYARVSPGHKLRVVTALQKRGHVVAMTGDGINDAPALKKADVGIAMGITGTDVTKEASSVTLTDDNFASIVAAVEEGRGIFSNIKKYLMYLLSSNIGEIALMAGASMIGLPLPLSAVQILYVNLATDGLPALALSVDPPDADLMNQKPRNSKSGIFTQPVVTLMAAGGAWSALVNISLFIWALQTGRSIAEAMTMTFVSLVLIQFVKAYNFRSDQHSVLHHIFANRWLNLAILWELFLLTMVIELPVLRKTFGTFRLSLTDWIIVITLALSVLPLLELLKWMRRRGWFIKGSKGSK